LVKENALATTTGFKSMNGFTMKKGTITYLYYIFFQTLRFKISR